MAVRIYIEIGHEASIRTKKTQEGFTHDWEVFVRGCDGAEIQYYIEKVVFYLHETFPKPKRVIKEPPYTVKESGYAGFNLPIDIYLRNNGEPKKIKFNYDLHLQHTGPAIYKVQKEKYIFNSPNEDFKMKLIKGGALIVSSSSSSSQDTNDNRTLSEEKNQLINKPKLSGADYMKKPKLKAGEPCRDFQELFGSPIFTTSKQVEVKPQPPKQDSKSSEKRPKHGDHKDSHKDKDKSKESDKQKGKDDKKSKEKIKDKERSKERDKSSKKDKSPRPKSPSPRRSPKRNSTPTRFSRSPVPSKHLKDKDASGNSKQHERESKRDKFEDGTRKSKKEKRSKEHRESKHGGDDQSKRSDDHNKEKDITSTKSRSDSKLKDGGSKIKSNNFDNTQTNNSPKIGDVKEKSRQSDKIQMSSKEDKAAEKDKYLSHSEKYKHKKKDKEKPKEKLKEKEEIRAHKAERKIEKASNNELKQSLFKGEAHIKKSEKSSSYPVAVAPPLLDEDSSSSSSSSSNSSIVERKVKVETPKTQKIKKEKGYQESGIKCKRKSNSVDKEEPPEKLTKDQSLNNNSDQEHDVKKIEVKVEEEDYFGVLRELQHKIMGLTDNADLQKVVQMIAETGRYEVSANTFDFDLCLLDRSTVQQLQEFFANNDT